MSVAGLLYMPGPGAILPGRNCPERSRGMEKQKKGLLSAVLIMLLAVLLTAPAYAATYNFAYPTAENKKGLMVGDGMMEDALELNISHATFNFPISHMIAHKSERNSTDSYSFKYKGKKYWFRKGHIHAWDDVLKKLKKNKIIVTGILLIDKRSDLKSLIYPSARNKSSGYYAWNMDGGENQKQIEAAISFLANRYTNSKYGKVVGWVVGNEINSASYWNRAGNVSFTKYMDIYAKMFERSSDIIHSVYSNARLYVPLDHFWNISFEGSETYKGKDCLNAFAARMKRDGYKWNLAYHAYNGDMTQPSITAKQKYGTTNDLDTPIITMKNLSVLTNYIRKTYGADTRIILSEQGYSSTFNGGNVSAKQSEAVALSYYLAMADPMVDSFVYYSHLDQNFLVKAGASYGLWKVSKSEKATSKKSSWSIFKYMDTNLSDPILDKARKTSEEMTGKKASATRSLQRGTLAGSGKYKRKKKLDKGWKKCGAVRTIRRKGASYSVAKNPSRNKNIYWGLERTVGKLNVSKCPRFCLTVRKGKLTSGKTELLVRFFSGNRNVFEASGKIASKKKKLFSIDLSTWKKKDAVTKIQILIKRESGDWKKGAGIVIENMGFR